MKINKSAKPGRGRWKSSVIIAAAVFAVAGAAHVTTVKSYAAENTQQAEQPTEQTETEDQTSQPAQGDGAVSDQSKENVLSDNDTDTNNQETDNEKDDSQNAKPEDNQQDTFTGVRQDKDSGKLFYYVNGVHDTSFTGIYNDETNSVHYDVVSGVVDDSFSGLLADKQENTYYFVKGVQATSYSGAVQNADGEYQLVEAGVDQGIANGVYTAEVNGVSGKWLFKDGAVDKNVSGIVSFGGVKYYIQAGNVSKVTDVIYTSDVNSPNVKNWYNIVDGVVKPGPTVSHNAHGWWYINQDGIVDFKYNGLATNQFGTWYLTGGQVHFNVTDVKLINGKWCNLVESKLTVGPTVAHNSNGWWYINKDGIVDFKYNGLASNKYGTWYLTNGKVHFNVTDVKLINGKWYSLVGSKLTVGPTVAHNSNGWWYIDRNGIVDFNYNGLASNRYGTWYLTDGKVHFNVTDVKYLNGRWYNLVGSKVTVGPTVAHNSNGWWYINQAGYVDFNYNGIASNRYGRWYLSGGKVHFNVNDVKYTNGHWYNLVGSKVTPGPTVAHNSNGWWYINQYGVVDFNYTGFAAGPNGSWYFRNGRPAAADPMDARAQQYSSPTGTLILVDCSKNITRVYWGGQNHWNPVQSYVSCTGKPSTPTVKGVFHVGSKGRYFNTGVRKQFRCWYYTQFYKDYLFHSVLYYKDSTPSRIYDGTLGRSASHGCVRLPINQAKWIYDNVPTGSTVVVY